MTQYFILKNTQKIENLYALLSEDKDGNNGIVSHKVRDQNFPMVGGYERMIPVFKEAAEKMVKDTGQKLILVKFSRIEIMEEFTNGS